MKPSVSQRKRIAIVQAAITEFHQSGFACSSMDAIAARAEVSKRTVYNHFSSKEALFNEISMQLCDSIAQVEPEPFDASLSLRAQLLEFSRRKMAHCNCAEFMLIAKVILPERVRNPQLAKEAFDRIRSGDVGLEKWLVQAMDAGKIRRSCEFILSRQFTALILEFSFWPDFFGIDPMPEQSQEACDIAEITVDLFLRGCEI